MRVKVDVNVVQMTMQQHAVARAINQANKSSSGSTGGTSYSHLHASTHIHGASDINIGGQGALSWQVQLAGSTNGQELASLSDKGSIEWHAGIQQRLEEQ